MLAPSRAPAVDMGRKRRDVEASDAAGGANVKATGTAMSKGRQQNSKKAEEHTSVDYREELGGETYGFANCGGALVETCGFAN